MIRISDVLFLDHCKNNTFGTHVNYQGRRVEEVKSYFRNTRKLTQINIGKKQQKNDKRLMFQH
jgi:hypothetical protein